MIHTRSFPELLNALQAISLTHQADPQMQSSNLELTERVQRMQSIFDNSPEGIAITDTEGNFIAVNELASVIFGYQTPADVIGKNILEVVYSGDHLIAYEISQEAIELGISGEKLIRFQHPDGAVVQISLRLSTLLDSEGKQFGFMGVTRDITGWILARDEEKLKYLQVERDANQREMELKITVKKLELELANRRRIEKHRDFLIQILESTTDIVAYADENLQLRYMNRAGLNFFGYKSSDEITGIFAHELHNPEIKERLYSQIIPEVRQKGYWNGENSLQNRAGVRIPVSQHISHHPENDPNFAFASIMRDISESKEKELAIKKSREMYQTLAEAAQDMIIIVDRENVIQYINRYGVAMVGMNADQIIGRPQQEVFGIQAEQAEGDSIQDVLLTGQPKYVEEVFHLKSGDSWMGSWLVPLMDDHNEYATVMAICRDISYEKEAEAQLSVALSREKELGDLKSRFISMASHEFRTPLSTIFSSAEILETYGEHWSAQKRLHHIDRIKGSVQQMDRLLEEILMIGRIEAGKIPIHPIAINPIEVCTNLIQDMVLTDHRRHQIQFSVTGSCESAYLDPELLRQILVNLLSNAIKFSQPSGKIDVHLNCHPDRLEFEIKDEGMGIPAEDMGGLFDPFNRAINAMSIPGSGLGLTIVKNALELCQGTIDIQSKLREGTKVHFMIPFFDKKAN